MTIDTRFMHGVHGSLFKLLRHIETQGGFLREAELSSLAEMDRLRQVLCRHNCCRYLAAAQDAAHIMMTLEAAGDHCRDVSLPTSDPIYRGDYSTNTTAEFHKPANSVRRNLDPQPEPTVKRGGVTERAIHPFNEADCGGSFDGFTVTSDADPGL